AMRSQLNTAWLLDANPTLLRLKELGDAGEDHQEGRRAEHVRWPGGCGEGQSADRAAGGMTSDEKKRWKSRRITGVRRAKGRDDQECGIDNPRDSRSSLRR